MGPQETWEFWNHWVVVADADWSEFSLPKDKASESSIDLKSGTLSHIVMPNPYWFPHPGHCDMLRQLLCCDIPPKPCDFHLRISIQCLSCFFRFDILNDEFHYRWTYNILPRPTFCIRYQALIYQALWELLISEGYFWVGFCLIGHLPSAMFTLNIPYHRQDQEKLLASEDLERTQVQMLMVSGLWCGSGDVFTISSMAFSFSLIVIRLGRENI